MNIYHKCLVLKSSITCYQWIMCSMLSISRFFFRIILQRKTLFIVTLQLVIFWLEVTAKSKCQTLGWCDKSTRTCTAERIRKSFLWNGWPQNQFLTAFTPSRATCKSIFLCKCKSLSNLSSRLDGSSNYLIVREHYDLTTVSTIPYSMHRCVMMGEQEGSLRVAPGATGYCN